MVDRSKGIGGSPPFFLGFRLCKRNDCFDHLGVDLDLVDRCPVVIASDEPERLEPRGFVGAAQNVGKPCIEISVALFPRSAWHDLSQSPRPGLNSQSPVKNFTPAPPLTH